MSVDLGFVEPCESDLLLNIHFPSKVGGRPAWLDLEKVPMPNDLKCEECGDQCLFLCQMYASLDRPEAFHRTIFVFICPNEKCFNANKNTNLKVFRNQIPRFNRFYAYDPVPESGTVKEADHLFPLCAVCGCRGPFNCAKCKLANYCSKTHQKIDWKARHKQICLQNNPDDSSTKTQVESIILFPEFEVILEQEEFENGENEDSGDEDEETDKSRVEEFKKLQLENKTGTMSDIPEGEFTQFTEKEDEIFAGFRKRISAQPDQVLRYDRGGTPLWITEDNIPAQKDIPPCLFCGTRRTFEFQIMPQMLNKLKCDSMDWGVLAVYTCERSCGTESKYIPEYIHKQDIVKNMDE